MTPHQAGLRVVVIGGGIAGCCAAYHLASAGVAHVSILERAELGGAATRLSTGAVDTRRSEPALHEMGHYATEFYPHIAAQSGLDIGWRASGQVVYTSSAECWDHMRSMPARATMRGGPAELLSPPQVMHRLRIVAGDDLLGGIWLPGDGRIDPRQAVIALSRLNLAQGVRISEHTAAIGVDVVNGAIRAVVTADAEIVCDAIVIAAGAWSPDVARLCGVQLPQQATETQYVVTDGFGVDPALPLFSSPDERLYGREAAGGLMISCIDRHALPVEPGEPLPERLDRFASCWQTALRRFPALQRVKPRTLCNAAAGFTPDGRMLLGPVPGISGVFAACGFGADGWAMAPAAGRATAEWIVAGSPRIDASAFDVRRFSPAQSDRAYLRERVTEIPDRRGVPPAAEDAYSTSRNVCRSPIHDRLAEVGARFAPVNAWERTVWCNQVSGGASWMVHVVHELRAAAAGVLVIDRSADAKYSLSGSAVNAWLDLAAPPSPAHSAVRRGHVDVRHLPGAHGQVEAVVRLYARGADRCHLSATPDQHTRLMEWIRRAKPPADVRVNDDTTRYACLEFHGPQRAALIEALCKTGSARIHVREDRCNASTVLTLAARSATEVWGRLRTLGRDADLSIGGHFAEEALRIERGTPAFGREITPFTHTVTLGAFSSPLTQLGFGGQEPILAGDRCIGKLTSWVRLPGWQSTLALGLIDFSQWRGEALQILSDGQRWPLMPRESAWEVEMRNS
jgi:glycine/D-amino acid oxidase-like deaminating enzyme/glycine cleavage system aminomethyltransferase T